MSKTLRVRFKAVPVLVDTEDGSLIEAPYSENVTKRLTKRMITRRHNLQVVGQLLRVVRQTPKESGIYIKADMMSSLATMFQDVYDILSEQIEEVELYLQMKSSSDVVRDIIKDYIPETKKEEEDGKERKRREETEEDAE